MKQTMKGKYNLLVKRHKDKPFLISDFIATKLNRQKFENLKAINPELLGEHDFIEYNETDFSWWSKVTKYLTGAKITRAYFDIDFHGNVTKY